MFKHQRRKGFDELWMIGEIADLHARSFFRLMFDGRVRRPLAVTHARRELVNDQWV
jgi:hypothetical protein